MYPKVEKLEQWQEQREIVAACLYSLAQHVDEHHQKTAKAGLAGNAIGVSGSVLGIAGVLMAPLTGGASMLPTTVAAVAAGGSAVIGVTSSVAKKVVDKRKEKKVFSSVEELLEDDRKSTEEIKELAEKLSKVEKDLKKFLLDLVMCDGEEEEVVGAAAANDTSCRGNQWTTPHHDHQMIPVSQSKEDLIHLKSILKKNIPDLVKKGLQCKAIMKQMATVSKDFIKGGTKAGKKSMQAIQIGKVAKVSVLFVTVVVLPFEVMELIQQAKDIKKKKRSTFSKEIQDQAQKLMDGIEIVRKELLEKVSAFNNLVILIHYIKQKGVSEILDTFLNQILKKLLPLKDIIQAFDRLEVQGSDEDGLEVNEDHISGLLINYTGVDGSLLKELAVTIWTAWKLSRKSFAFLQNTCFMTIPALWTLFGVSTDSFSSGNGQGVSILLPLDFDGDVVSHHEFQHTSDDWKGRGILLNVTIGGSKYSLVNVLAPNGHHDRALFLQEITRFITCYADGELILASNIQTEIQSMTVLCKKKKVCPYFPWSITAKFLPYRSVAEYLVNFLGFEADEPNTKVFEVCKDLTLGDPNEVFINWACCEKPVLSVEDCSKQIQPILSLGLTDLWKAKNCGKVEFSSHEVVSGSVVSCSRSLDFFVSEKMEQNCGHCSIDHDLRFLGFLKESVLVFGEHHS